MVRLSTSKMNNGKAFKVKKKCNGKKKKNVWSEKAWKMILKWKRNEKETENYNKLTDQTLKSVELVIEKLISRQVSYPDIELQM